MIRRVAHGVVFAFYLVAAVLRLIIPCGHDRVRGGWRAGRICFTCERCGRVQYDPHNINSLWELE